MLRKHSRGDLIGVNLRSIMAPIEGRGIGWYHQHQDCCRLYEDRGIGWYHQHQDCCLLYEDRGIGGYHQHRDCCRLYEDRSIGGYHQHRDCCRLYEDRSIGARMGQAPSLHTSLLRGEARCFAAFFAEFTLSPFASLRVNSAKGLWTRLRVTGCLFADLTTILEALLSMLISKCLQQQSLILTKVI